jgi:hypothetical protein
VLPANPSGLFVPFITGRAYNYPCGTSQSQSRCWPGWQSRLEG